MMFIDRYRQEDGVYVDPDGCQWDCAETFLHGYVLGFCCCGSPIKSLEYVKWGLEHIDDQRSRPNGNNAETKEWYKNWKQAGFEMFGEEGLEFFFHWANDKGLTDHGCCVPGWLTNKGRELLSDLKELMYNILGY